MKTYKIGRKLKLIILKNGLKIPYTVSSQPQAASKCIPESEPKNKE